jgi:enamine deaminase RidA (YjgF/YER057c/UK114 family)
MTWCEPGSESENMMNRFTPQAQEALQRAQQIMFAKHHIQLDVEHIFLAVLQQRDGVTAQLITRLGGTPQAMMSLIDRALNDMPNFSTNRGASTTGYITLRAQRMLQRSAEEADHLKDEYISTEHILLAVRGEGGLAAKALQEAGIDHDKITAALQEIRAESRDTDVKLEEHYPHAAGTGHSEWRPKVVINPPELAKPRGFSHGIAASGRMLFLAGQTASDREGRIVAPGDLVAQYRQVLTNLEVVVEEAGGEMRDIVKTNIFVKDRDDYLAHLKPLGEIHRSFFGAYYPVTSLFEISRFFQDEVLVEIEGIAVLIQD